MPPTTFPPRACEWCDEEYEPERARRRFCSTVHRVYWNRAHPGENLAENRQVSTPAVPEELAKALHRLSVCERRREMLEDWLAHDSDVPELVPARGTRALVRQGAAVLGELTSGIDPASRGYREQAAAYARRLRKADRADAAEELQELAAVLEAAQGWVTWTLDELEALDCY